MSGNSPEKIMVMGQTYDAFLFGFKPPLSFEEIQQLPKPKSSSATGGIDRVTYDAPDGTIKTLMAKSSFSEEENFEAYAARVAAHIGYSLRPGLLEARPGSLIEQAERVDAQELRAQK